VSDVDTLAAEYWEHTCASAPSSAHLLGDYRRAGEFESVSAQSEERDVAALRAFARRAEELDDVDLDDGQRLTRRVLALDAAARADVLEQRLREVAADPIFGLQLELPVVLPMLALPDADVAEALVEKYRGVGRHYRELAERQREGVARGRHSAAFAVSATVRQIDAVLATPVADDALLVTSTPPAGIDVDGWKARLRRVVEEEVRPGMAAYRDVLREEVLAGARPDERAGLSFLEGGDAAYDVLLRYYTTTDLSAREIHQIGLEQVEKLAEEYRALGPEAVGTDDLQQIFAAMRSDPALHFQRGEDVVTASEVAMQRAWDAMPEWFEVMPRARCAVRAVTTGAQAYYVQPATDGSRGGTFFVNVEDPAAWGTFELESMAFHEGIPGHHLQLTIASELTGVPEFRKHLFVAAYGEGWGLYTERLADEMGLYTGPVDRMGMYAADSMRACRLVVDTGVHALGWSRERAVQYMVDNSPLTEGIVRPEIDRYLVSPGQACSYMVGRLEIQRMRAEAEQRQGDRFDVKAFHSAVLDSGSLPLEVLDEVVRTRLP
jgi:uncharacterized protein (DUF885 family)